MTVLIASPHMDDEVLGCSSFLLDNAIDVSIIYTTNTHPEYPQVREENLVLIHTLNEQRRRWARDQRDNSRAAKVEPAWTRVNAINRLDLTGQAILIGEFEDAINAARPSTVLVPAPSYNQDHRAVYDAMLTACRPHDRNHFVKRVLAYEEPETWGTLRAPEPFRATYFRPVDIGAKVNLYHVYASQVRAHRSDMDICALAHLRAMQAGMRGGLAFAAEAFEVLRWVE